MLSLNYPSTLPSMAMIKFCFQTIDKPLQQNEGSHPQICTVELLSMACPSQICTPASLD